MKCPNCAQLTEDCICDDIDDFFQDSEEFLDDSEDDGTRCLACYFSPCRCKDGLDAKRGNC